MSGKKLIINADDFGICEATNKAIKQLWQNGLITSTSLLACASATDEALSIAKSLEMPLGVHLALNSDFTEQPWNSLSKCKSICDQNHNLFYDTKQLAKKAKSKDVQREAEAQIKVIRDYGVKIDHIDNHSGTMYGINMRAFFIIAFRLAKKYNLPFRFPKSGRFLDDFFKANTPLIVKLAHKCIFGIGKIMHVRLIDDMISNPFKADEIACYKNLEEYYLKAITNIKCGSTELFLHPSYHCPVLSTITREWKKRVWELEFLYSLALENRLKDEGIELISYSQV